MIHTSSEMEMRAVLDAAARICAAARTAPKAKGEDYIVTLVLTDNDKDALADAMERYGEKMGAKFFIRDAGNVRTAQAIVLIGAKEGQRGLNEMCRYCHKENCADCNQTNSLCAMDAVDVGIALGSAAATAADLRMDSRILFSAGRAAIGEKLMGEDVTLVFGLPISVSGKSPFFDRKPKQ